MNKYNTTVVINFAAITLWLVIYVLSPSLINLIIFILFVFNTIDYLKHGK